MQVRTFIYEKSWYGSYHRQRLLNRERMDKHIEKMLGDGWEILAQTSQSGRGTSLQPFSKRDTITISFRKPNPVSR